MSLQVTSIADLTVDQIEQAKAFIKQLVMEEQPDADVRTGVIGDLLIEVSAQHMAANREEIDRYRRSTSLLAIEADPTLADDDTVDRLLSNYRITRGAGAAASGEVTVVVSALSPVTVPNGAVFEGDGKQYTSNASYVARTTSANVLATTDRLLTQTADGKYAFTINVTAVASGSAGMLPKNTALVPQVQIVNFVKAFASSDFSGGLDSETNSQLLARVQEGLSASVLSNRSSMASLLRGNFPSILHSSIIGYGDAEMLRDQHSVLPVSFGGRVDWYVRTQALPQKLGVTKTATLVQKTVDGYGVWQFSVGRDEAPGFYDVQSVTPLGDEAAGTFTISQEIRSTDLTPILGELTPDIANKEESAFSRYQATVVQFKDDQTVTDTLTVGTSTKSYSVTLRHMPDIADIQAVMGSRSVRNYAGDVLVRAPVPCFVSLSFTLEGKAGASLPDPYEVRDNLASYVNNLGFRGRLHASDLLDIIHNSLSGQLSVSAIDMNGELLRPDGTVRRLRSSETLIIPDESDRMVSARTVGFILDPNDVLISARTVNIPEI